MDKNTTTILAAAIIAIGLAALGLCIKCGFDSFSNRDRLVTVRGLCEREVNANKVTWPIVTKEQGDDLPTIYSSIEQSNEAIKTFLKENGITEDEISIAAPNVTDAAANEYAVDRPRARYFVTNVMVVTSSKVDLVRSLVARQPELLKKGIAIVAGDYSYHIDYEYTDLNTIKPEMIAEATANAREAAAKFAEDSGSAIGKIQSAQQGQFSIEDRDQYTPNIKTVRVVTYLTYQIDD